MIDTSSVICRVVLLSLTSRSKGKKEGVVLFVGRWGSGEVGIFTPIRQARTHDHKIKNRVFFWGLSAVVWGLSFLKRGNQASVV